MKYAQFSCNCPTPPPPQPPCSYPLAHAINRLFQVKAQLHCTKRKYCDFVVWTIEEIFIQRITRNDELLARNIPNAKEFWEKGVLPELLARWFSRTNPFNKQSASVYSREPSSNQ